MCRLSIGAITAKMPKGRLRRTRSVRKPSNLSQRSGLYLYYQQEGSGWSHLWRCGKNQSGGSIASLYGIGQFFGKDNVQMVCRTKLPNQLGVTAPIEDLHMWLKLSNLIGQDKLSAFSEILGDITYIFCLVPRNNIFHMHAKF